MVEASKDSIQAILAAHIEAVNASLQRLPEAKASFSYLAEKWTVRQVVGHLYDSHIIFKYRALCISRGEMRNLPGFDENRYTERWLDDTIPFPTLIQAFALEAKATLAHVAMIRPMDWERFGVANGIELTPLVIYRAMIGHERHHLRILRECYGVE